MCKSVVSLCALRHNTRTTIALVHMHINKHRVDIRAPLSDVVPNPGSNSVVNGNKLPITGKDVIMNIQC